MSSDIEELEALTEKLEQDPSKAEDAAMVRRAISSANEERVAELELAMAGVLFDHPSLYGAYDWTCSGCMADIGNVWSGIGPQLLAAHQAAMLTAAGFGLVKAAAAGAWDEGYEAAIEAYDGRNGSNPYRAATIEAPDGP